MKTFFAQLLTLILLAALASSTLAATSSIRLSELADGQASLGPRLGYPEDPSQELTLTDITSRPAQDWQPSEAQVPNFGFSQSSFWFRIEIINDGTTPASHLIEVGNPALDYLDLYVVPMARLRTRFSLAISFLWPRAQ